MKEAHSSPTLPQHVCGVLVLQWFGLPVPCDQNGPFSVKDLNQMLAPFNVHLVRCYPKTPAIDGKCVCVCVTSRTTSLDYMQERATSSTLTMGRFRYGTSGRWLVLQTAPR